MLFFNAARYTATQISATSYALTLDATFEAIPDGTVGIVMFLRDTAGAAARVLGDLSSNVLTITQIFSTTLSSNSMPAFGAGLQAASGSIAETLDLGSSMAGLIATGQSNIVSQNTGKSSIDPLYLREIDNRVKQSLFNLAGKEANIGYAIEPLEHQVPSVVATTLSCMIPFSQVLADEEGWGEVCILAHGIPSAAISIYDDGEPAFVKVVDDIVEWLTDSPHRRLVAWVQQQGETDNGLGTAQDVYRDKNIAFRANVAADVLTQTGVDITRTAFLAIGLGPDYIAGQGGGGQAIADAIADIPNNMAFSAFVDLPAGVSRNASSNEGGSTDPTHLSAEGNFLVGSTLLYPALLEARKNFSPSALGLSLLANAANLALPDTISDIDAAEAEILNATAPVLALPDTISEIETTVAISIVDTLALNPTSLYRSDLGVQTSGINVTQVDDLSGNALHLTPNLGTVTLVANELTFDGSSNLTNTTGSFTQNPPDSTMIIQFAGTGEAMQEGLPNGSSRISSSGGYFMKPGIGTNFHVDNSPSPSDGVERVYAMTLDASFFKVYRENGVGNMILLTSNAAGGPGGFSTKTTLGGFGDSLLFTGVITRYCLWQGTALTAAEIDTVIAEF